jgi:phosphohistidine phosphatase
MIPFRVYLVQHGDAEASGHGGDSTRRLSPEGRMRFAALVQALAPELRLSRILTSPLVRARETADLLAAGTGVIVEEEPSLAPGRSTGSDLLTMAAQAGSGVALVCHNPELAEAVTLVSEKPQPIAPGSVVAIEVTDGAYRLAWVREG